MTPDYLDKDEKIRRSKNMKKRRRTTPENEIIVSDDVKEIYEIFEQVCHIFQKRIRDNGYNDGLSLTDLKDIALMVYMERIDDAVHWNTIRGAR